MPIDVRRVFRDIEAIAGFSEVPPPVGYSRPTFSPSWMKAVDYVSSAAKEIGCVIRVDAAGNLHARPAHLSSQEPVWLSGSHIDSVPKGGKYDGVAGVVAALEILRAAYEDKRIVPLELIIFAEEEGTTFGLGMLGSKAWVGNLLASELAGVRNAAGENYLEAGKSHGVRADALASERFDRKHYIGLIELHIEQGPALWNAGKKLAIVTAIAGRKQYRAVFHGVANHAGSTSMRDRHDALAAAALVITRIEELAKELSEQTVATVGRIDCRPNAVNVIAEFVEFTIDLRAPGSALLADGDRRINAITKEVADQRSLRWELETTEDQSAIVLDVEICQRLRDAAGDVTTTVSRALHDAAILAPHLPTAMIFVPSKDGISHNPMEHSRVEDIAAGAGVFYKMIQG
jgi:allantoate deiminase